MKRTVCTGFAALALAVVVSCASMVEPEGTEGVSLDDAIEQSAAKIAAELPGKTRVAIVAFDSEYGNVSNYIMDELTGALVDGSLEVADRRNLAFVYKELNFQMSGDVSDETAVSIGKFLGAKYVVTGQLIKAGTRYRYRLAGINVETAVRESSTRLNVRNDRDLRGLLADVRDARVTTASAGYGAGQAGAQPASAAPPSTAGAFLDRGILFATRGDFSMAVDEFTEAIALDGKLVAAYLLRGRALAASVSYVIGIEEGFSSFSFTLRSSLTASQKAAYDRAIADCTQAIKLDPNLAQAYRERGRMYHVQGDYDRGIADYTQAIRLDPNYARAYYNRGTAYSDKGDYDRGITDYNQAIKLDPNYAVAYFANAYINRGVGYSDKGDYDRAIADYTQAIRLDPNNVYAYTIAAMRITAKATTTGPSRTTTRLSGLTRITRMRMPFAALHIT